VRRTVPPSAEIEERIENLLAVGVGENPRESLSELAKLGARLIIQRAVEDEFNAWLGRARYERRPDYQRGLRNYESGLRNGFRPRKVQTAEGELSVEIPQVREAAETFASKLFPRGTKLVRTEPLKALVIGAFVRGLSMRDVESLCEKAGLGKLSKSTASRVCEELRERFEAFKRRDLYDLNLVALFLDATVRHEALSDRAGCKTPPLGCRSSPVKLRAEPDPGAAGKGGSGPDNDAARGDCRTVRARLARWDGVMQVNQ
jgi:putative transposase